MLDDLIKQFKDLVFNRGPQTSEVKTDTRLQQLKSLDKTDLGFIAPVAGAYYNSGNFSPGVATDKRHLEGHNGIDVRAKKGSTAQSMADGIITNVANTPKGGINITIKFNNGYKAYYAHLDSVSIKIGDKVKAGSPVGKVGNTGNAIGGVSHIHLQVWSPKGVLINPATLFNFPKYTAYSKGE